MEIQMQFLTNRVEFLERQCMTAMQEMMQLRQEFNDHLESCGQARVSPATSDTKGGDGDNVDDAHLVTSSGETLTPLFPIIIDTYSLRGQEELEETTDDGKHVGVDDEVEAPTDDGQLGDEVEAVIHDGEIDIKMEEGRPQEDIETKATPIFSQNSDAISVTTEQGDEVISQPDHDPLEISFADAENSQNIRPEDEGDNTIQKARRDSSSSESDPDYDPHEQNTPQKRKGHRRRLHQPVGIPISALLSSAVPFPPGKGKRGRNSSEDKPQRTKRLRRFSPSSAESLHKDEASLASSPLNGSKKQKGRRRRLSANRHTDDDDEAMPPPTEITKHKKHNRLSKGHKDLVTCDNAVCPPLPDKVLANIFEYLPLSHESDINSKSTLEDLRLHCKKWNEIIVKIGRKRLKQTIFSGHLHFHKFINDIENIPTDGYFFHNHTFCFQNVPMRAISQVSMKFEDMFGSKITSLDLGYLSHDSNKNRLLESWSAKDIFFHFGNLQKLMLHGYFLINWTWSFNEEDENIGRASVMDSLNEFHFCLKLNNDTRSSFEFGPFLRKFAPNLSVVKCRQFSNESGASDDYSLGVTRMAYITRNIAKLQTENLKILELSNDDPLNSSGLDPVQELLPLLVRCNWKNLEDFNPPHYNNDTLTNDQKNMLGTLLGQLVSAMPKLVEIDFSDVFSQSVIPEIRVCSAKYVGLNEFLISNVSGSELIEKFPNLIDCTVSTHEALVRLHQNKVISRPSIVNNFPLLSHSALSVLHMAVDSKTTFPLDFGHRFPALKTVYFDLTLKVEAFQSFLAGMQNHQGLKRLIISGYYDYRILSTILVGYPQHVIGKYLKKNKVMGPARPVIPPKPNLTGLVNLTELDLWPLFPKEYARARPALHAYVLTEAIFPLKHFKILQLRKFYLLPMVQKMLNDRNITLITPARVDVKFSLVEDEVAFGKSRMEPDNFLSREIHRSLNLN